MCGMFTITLALYPGLTITVVMTWACGHTCARECYESMHSLRPAHTGNHTVHDCIRSIPNGFFLAWQLKFPWLGRFIKHDTSLCLDVFWCNAHPCDGARHHQHNVINCEPTFVLCCMNKNAVNVSYTGILIPVHTCILKYSIGVWNKKVHKKSLQLFALTQ